MLMDLKSVVAIVSRYQADLSSNKKRPGSPLLRKLELQRIQVDLPVLLHCLKRHKSNKVYSDTLTQIHRLSGGVDKLIFENNVALAAWLAQFSEPIPNIRTPPQIKPVQEIDDDESYASLRRRLLADGPAASKLETATNEQLNKHHESVQEDLVFELSNLTSTLKTSAMNLSSKITTDSKLVSGTTEQMSKNLSLMKTVSVNLNEYLTSKTGGKISLFFTIKTMVFIIVLFMIMAYIAKFLPKM